MTKDDEQGFRELVFRLDTVFDKPSSGARATIYFEELKDIPFALIKAAIGLHTKRARTYPRPAELRVLADEAQGISGDETPRALPPHPYDPDGEPAPPACATCSDTGWQMTTKRAPIYGRDATVEAVKRCHCWRGNPQATQKRTRYGHRDADFHRSW